MFFFSYLQLRKGTGLPKHICKDCQNAINDAHSLRENILKVQRLFKDSQSYSKLLSEDVSATEFVQLGIKEENDKEDDTKPPDKIFNGIENIIEQQDYNISDIKQEEINAFGSTNLIESDEDVSCESLQKESSQKVRRYRKCKLVKKSPSMISDCSDYCANELEADEFMSDVNDEEFTLNADFTNIYKCSHKQCKYIAKSQQALKVHFLRHTGDKRFECK